MKTLTIFLLGSLLFAFTGCAGGPQEESFGQSIDSTAITTKVKTALLKSERVSGTDINVETFKDQVMLSGFVNSEEQMQEAVQLAAQIQGVKSVINNIEIRAE